MPGRERFFPLRPCRARDFGDLSAVLAAGGLSQVVPGRRRIAQPDYLSSCYPLYDQRDFVDNSLMTSMNAGLLISSSPGHPLIFSFLVGASFALCLHGATLDLRQLDLPDRGTHAIKKHVGGAKVGLRV
jgi:hypothetical protein